MDDISGLLARDFGVRAQGKSAPMAASKNDSTHGSFRSGATWTNSGPTSSPSYDNLFGPAQTQTKPAVNQPPADRFNQGPVFDTPLYDDEDIFDGVPGIKTSSSVPYDVFSSVASDRGRVASPPPYDDLLASLGKTDSGNRRLEEMKGQDLSGFEDLIPGFGGSSTPAETREVPETSDKKPSKPMDSSPTDDPFVFFSDPLENITKSKSSDGPKISNSSVADGLFSDPNSFDGLSNSAPLFTTSNLNENFKEKSPGNSFRDTTNVPLFTTTTPDISETLKGKASVNGSGSFHKKEPSQQSPIDGFDDVMPKPQSNNKSGGAHSSDPFGRSAMDDQSPKSSEQSETGDDVWLTVSEIPLFTKPTSAPPPSRPPPPLSVKQNPNHSYSFHRDSPKVSGSSPVDELEDFAMGKSQRFGFEEEAAVKEAVDKAEARFKHAREVRERELREREREEEERERLEKEREESEERERRMRAEREREERERARQAVERATREARERAGAEARMKAERENRIRVERAAVQRAAQEARERAAAEARERVEREKAERAERAEKEAREREARERAEREAAQRKAQRAAVERAAAEARERAATAAREKQQQQQQQQQRQQQQQQQQQQQRSERQTQRSPEDDLESFFGAGSRSTSVPKRPTPPESVFDSQNQSRGAGPFDSSQRTPSASAATIRKASSSTNIVDDLSSIFGGPSSSNSTGEFQNVEGESEERRRARFERHQRTNERAAKALAEKNERDLQMQREQAERHRIAETLDFEIKRWAAGKEGNLRALLSTLQYILWPQCGWQPVSLTDLITAASVKKVYRKASLCVHPDKVQQRGATLQQKYIAEKVFDLLKEAYNKFNSEELF